MRSRFVDKFNHDDEAPGYDEDVADERNPIREGYSALLRWVVDQASAGGSSSVLELGTGTGNLAILLEDFDRMVCVDISANMLGIARAKLADRPNVEYVQADLLQCFEALEERFDVVISAYAIHHLTEEERHVLFRSVERSLEPGGRAVFGDLLFADDEERRDYLAALRSKGESDLADEIEDEFFWNVEETIGELVGLGFRVTKERFSRLSWGICAER
jgi:putative AdoMet-dependent methyltransferase